MTSRLFLELLTNLLNSWADFEVVGTTDVAERVVSGFAQTKTQILLPDFELPDLEGTELLARAARKSFKG